MTQTFSLTEKQIAANKLLASRATHIMLFGGSRSGKTFLIVRAVIIRALKAPNSRHVILRYRFNAVKQSIVLETFPEVMAKCFPNVNYTLNKTDWFFTFQNGSEVWIGGLDDKERTEKILGRQFATIYLNECSQIPWSSRGIAVTRLAQVVMQKVQGMEDVALPLKMYYDENPPDKGHWTYRYFIQKLDPETRRNINDPLDVESMQINPRDNVANLPDSYIKTLEGLSVRLQRRFLEGSFKNANPDALFNEADIDKWRVLDGVLPDFQRIIVAVDPSGADDDENEHADAIGIVVAALGIDGNAYVLEDLTLKAGPATWGKVVASAYERHEADLVVAEINYGGAMVRQVIQSVRPQTPFYEVRATRGKVKRAEPISSLVEQGKVRFVGHFPDLEDELSAFTVDKYLGEGSPNRADAFVWAIATLFPALVKPAPDKPKETPPMYGYNHPRGWMT